jgi:hypothetical protein
MSNIRALVVLSDLHIGSTVALLPPGFVTMEGNAIGQTPLQSWLWECWEQSNQWIAETLGKSPYGLVLNGDLIEGLHHRTTQVISPDLADQIVAAKQVLIPVAKKAKKVFVVKGTECHTGNVEAGLGTAIGAEIDPDTGVAAFDRLTIDVAGVRCVFRHHIGTSVRRALSATQLSIQLAEEQVEAAVNGEVLPQVLCCAHRHKFGKYEDEKGLCVVSPPWQGLSRFAHKVVSQARTKPGVFILDWRGLPDGHLPAVHRLVFDTPHPKTISL